MDSTIYTPTNELPDWTQRNKAVVDLARRSASFRDSVCRAYNETQRRALERTAERAVRTW